MYITPETTIRIPEGCISIYTIEQILNVLREHGTVLVEIVNSLGPLKVEVPTLAEILYR